MRRVLPTAVVATVAVVVLAFGGSATASGENGPKQYVIAFNSPNDLPASADAIVAAAGGEINVRLAEIGAVGAVSDHPGFLETIRSSAHVKAANEDSRLSVPPGLDDDPVAQDAENNGGTEGEPGPDPQPMPDNLGREQWDKMRMNATVTGSYAVQRGRDDVVVAVLDTGGDVLPTPHVDIHQNLDYGRSRSFVTPTGDALPAGDPNPASWDDKHGHGSWCLSGVGAPINTLGISGVAPDVTLVVLKVLGDNGSGSWLALANALVYAGLNHFDVASMSLGGYLPKNDHEAHALWIVNHRAIQFARSNGVLPVAAAANDNFNLSDGDFFRSFVEAPGEIAGVVTVSATGYYNQKAHYSNYGPPIDLSAPGGATRNYTGVPGSGAAPGYNGEGRVLGAWAQEGLTGFPPVLREEECTGGTGTPPCSYYAWVQGTSMATPHVAGVAALIISQYGDFDPNNPNMPHMSPTTVESYLQISANNRPCPEPKTVTAGPGFVFPTSTCQGDTGNNTFFGKGIADALKAVTLK